MVERTLSTTRFSVGSVVSRLRLLFVGTLTGVVGGMGSFLFINSEFMPLGLGENWGLLIIGVAGVYTHVLTTDLAESVSVMIVSVFVAIGVHTSVAIAPLWILSYSPVARDLLLPVILGRAIAGNIFGYLMTFLGAYFAAMLVDGYYES